jgi:hypothetical protein
MTVEIKGCNNRSDVTESICSREIKNELKLLSCFFIKVREDAFTQLLEESRRPHRLISFPKLLFDKM